MKKVCLADLLIIGFFIGVFVFIRSVNFAQHQIFTQDSASDAINALEIWRNKKLVLLGPPISFRMGARHVFQGSITYYFLLIFLLLGRFDPLLSSYLFMLFCSLMTVPLYFGVKLLLNKKSAIVLLCLYSLFPFYINHTVFFWNPNFQFSLLPILILFMGLYQLYKKPLFIFLIGLVCGILLLFHYQFILIIVGLFMFYFLIKKERLNKMPIFIGGLILGFLPTIIFEIRNNFYNLKTFLYFLQNFHQVFLANRKELNFYYFLSPSIFIFILSLSLIYIRITKFHLCLFFIILLTVATFNYILRPWTQSGKQICLEYLDELKVYSIIKGQKYQNFNVSSPTYDNVAVAQKYFLRRDNIKIDFDNYYKNKYLYIINPDENFNQYEAYEIKTFTPSKIIRKWKINNKYNLYLLERLHNN